MSAAHQTRPVLSKVPAVTLGFWIVKIAATTLGETGGDTVSMTMNLGYLIGTAIFLTALVVLVAVQISARRFHPFLYWATIIASTTAGTTMADFADRSLGIGYAGGSTLLLVCVLGILGLWYWSQGTVSVDTVNTAKVEAFYWATITFSQTLGTALGDWVAAGQNEEPPGMGLGYEIGALVFGGALAIVAVLYLWNRIEDVQVQLRGLTEAVLRQNRSKADVEFSPTSAPKFRFSYMLLFWAAFILTRPLGATVGDFLDKPLSHGGLALSRPLASAVLAVFIVGCILILPQRPGTHPGQPDTA